MKTIFSFILGIALLSNVALADWITYSSGTNNNLSDVHFLNEHTGFIAGQGGTVLKSTNSGSSWETVTVPAAVNLYGISFPTNLVGYICGGNTTNAKIIKTTDGGNTWVALSTGPVSTLLRDIDFINESTGFAVGTFKNIIKTTDGGQTWIQTLGGGNSSQTLSSVKMLSAQEVVVCGWYGSISDLIYKTTNGGTDWESKTSGAISQLSDIDFVNSNEGYIMGGNVILKTINRGGDWTAIPIQGYSNIAGLKFITAITAYAVGYNGAIIKTTDAGFSWSLEASGTNASLVDIDKTSAHIHVVGADGIYIRAGNPIGIQNISSEIPSGYKLSQNYPNPFNPVTNIEFSIPSKGNVKLTVFDITGKEVGLLINDVLSPGTYKFDFNANHLSSGTYFYRLVAGDYVETKKMVLVK